VVGPAHSYPPRPALDRLGPSVPLELTTVADDEAVLFRGSEVVHLDGLMPDTAYDHDGVEFRTLPRPGGELLTVVATVNDLHFGEAECGRIEGFDIGPVLTAEPGDDPYPEVMNRAAVAEISAREPAAVVAKGDLTSGGTGAEYQAFLDCYRPAFGERLHWVGGNHDGRLGPLPSVEVNLQGVTLAILDTTMPGAASGRLDGDQLVWLDDLAARADRPVLVFGHHHAFDPASHNRPATYFGINPDDSERLVNVVARRPRLVGYFAGHTHRNRVRRFQATGDVPWVEVACVKDFPGTWAEYRVFEGGILQVHRRIAEPKALAWSERCRSMLAGLYPQYAFGGMGDRCFPISPR
jgi:3',5'-cyclic-AMP phosphodiesterase